MLTPINQQITPLGAANRRRNEWWLAGGIDAGDCLAAYQAKGTSTIEASQINLVNPGTYNLTATANLPVPVLVANGWDIRTTKKAWNTQIPSNLISSVVMRWVDFARGSGTNIFGAYGGNLCYIGSDPDFVRFANGSGSYTSLADSNTNETVGWAGDRGFINGVFAGNIVTGAKDNYPAAIGGTSLSPACYVDEIWAVIGITIAAAVMYSVALTDAQVLAVSTEMNLL